MKKKIIIPIILAVATLLVLFLPFVRMDYDDGGTTVYAALTYKVVKWDRPAVTYGATGYKRLEAYENTALYWFPKNFKSYDELWEIEKNKHLNVEPPIKEDDSRIKREFVYVAFVGKDCFVADINDARVLIKCEGIGEEIKRFDTLLVEYHIDDWKNSLGSYQNGEGQYEAVIEKVINVRHSRPEEGEPLIG